jgi:hypothetical protein
VYPAVLVNFNHWQVSQTLLFQYMDEVEEEMMKHEEEKNEKRKKPQSEVTK